MNKNNDTENTVEVGTVRGGDNRYIPGRLSFGPDSVVPTAEESQLKRVWPHNPITKIRWCEIIETENPSEIV